MKHSDHLTHGISTLSSHPLVQHVFEFFRHWKFDENALLYILPALAIGFFFGRSRARRAASFRNFGEGLLSRAVQENFNPPDYHLMNHITLRLSDGTTEIDHILISRFGVFVIETKDYKGWIFANANHEKWTQVLYRWRFKFQNPLFQNNRHVRAVMELLDFVPPDAIKSVVVFAGNGRFMTETPTGVFNIPKFIDYVREQTVEVLSVNRVQFCVGRIEATRLAISGKTDVEHVASLERRHGRVL